MGFVSFPATSDTSDLWAMEQFMAECEKTGMVINNECMAKKCEDTIKAPLVDFT